MKLKNRLKRILKHLLTTRKEMLACFSKQKISEIEDYISNSEKKHMAELLCVIESSLDFKSLWYQKGTRERALEWFGLTRLWDTDLNIGLLIYFSFADRKIEIIADRGITQLVSNEVWSNICSEISVLFTQKKYNEGLSLGLKMIEEVLLEILPRNDIPYHNQYLNQIILV